MKPIPITEVDIFQEACVFGKKMLFTILRVDRESLPEGLFRYDIRHCDDDWGEAATIERNVLVNHMGAVITDEELDLGENGYLCFDKEDDFCITDHPGIDPSNIDNVLNYFKIEKYFNRNIKTEDNLMSKANFYNKTVKAIQLSADNFDDVNEFTGNELFICSKRVDGEVEYAIMTCTGKMSIVRVGDFIVMEDGELHVVSCERFLDAYRLV